MIIAARVRMLLLLLCCSLLCYYECGGALLRQTIPLLINVQLFTKETITNHCSIEQIGKINGLMDHHMNYALKRLQKGVTVEWQFGKAANLRRYGGQQQLINEDDETDNSRIILSQQRDSNTAKARPTISTTVEEMEDIRPDLQPALKDACGDILVSQSRNQDLSSECRRLLLDASCEVSINAVNPIQAQQLGWMHTILNLLQA